MSTLAAVNLKNPSSATNNVVLATNGDLQFNSGYGSAATAYGCRAWANWNGTGTVAIRASGNVSSITDNGTGNYTVNFTTAMADANYCVQGSAGATNTQNIGAVRIGAQIAGNTFTTSAVQVQFTNGGEAAYIDLDRCFVSIFR